MFTSSLRLFTRHFDNIYAKLLPDPELLFTPSLPISYCLFKRIICFSMCAIHILLGVRPPTEAWLNHQELHP